MSVLQQNYHNVLAQIAGAEASAGRKAGEVRLVAVGKTFPAGDIREVYAAGQRDFGENYIQEWYEKTEDLADLSDIVWHIIGDVQSNKTKFVAERAHWVHTIGRLKTARRLSAQRPSEMPPLQVCIEVNIAGEAFGRMRALLAELNAAGVVADVLSMGMSGDMEIAVACGATHVRIGSAIFGRRDYSK